MIEKKTMGYVDFEYTCYEAKAVTVIVDSETGKVELYRPNEDEDEWYTPNENDHFYPTVEDAADALMKHKQEMFDKMGEVKNYLDAMDNWKSYGIAEDDPLHFTEKDYLPYCIQRKGTSESYWEERYKEVDKTNDYLLGIVRTGFINVKGDSFKVDDIKHIKWGEHKVEIILNDDRIIETGNKTEFNIIEYLFGKNISKFTYTRLNDNTDEE